MNGAGNQSAPFFLSTQGRYVLSNAPFFLSTQGKYVWSNAPFEVKVREGQMLFLGEKPIKLVEGGKTLKDAYTSAYQAHF